MQEDLRLLMMRDVIDQAIQMVEQAVDIGVCDQLRCSIRDFNAKLDVLTETYPEVDELLNLITQNRWCELVDCGAGKPKPLSTADLSKPFVYDRKFGVFHCRLSHQMLMATLYGWHTGIDIDDNEDNLDYGQLADKYLEEIPGTCFLSSMAQFNENRVTCWSKDSLNAFELGFFDKFDYIGEF